MQSNPDNRGCLFEVFRESWEGVFPTVQWNACASAAGVVRGVHVHAEYHDFYTLPRGRVILGLAEIRRESATFGKSVQFEWADSDGMDIVVPICVAHVVYFIEDSALAFGLSGYWNKDLDVVGYQWDDPRLGFEWPDAGQLKSNRDQSSGSFAEMITDYEKIREMPDISDLS